MNFDEVPVIPTPPLFRAAKVSNDMGQRVLSDLEQRGEVHPDRTPSGRILLTPRDGRAVFNAIRKS